MPVSFTVLVIDIAITTVRLRESEFQNMSA